MNKQTHRWFLIAICLLWTQLSVAVSDSINYQGYLTDPTGAPIDGTLNISFNIYSVSVGGTPLWSDTQSVSVSDGLFSVTLGGGSFPANLFDAPIWLGLSVEADEEMTPRRPFDSVAFAFKADDADTVGGLSAGTLDQSAHVIDSGNPHNVTAAQVGAADAAALNAHVSNTANPHNVTAAQTGAVDSTSFNAHAGNSSAHHSRYSDAEAVTAMGANANGNPLHHDRYTDVETVAAVLAADGAGSTFDADLVDGLQASEIIDAASDEVRTPISSLPYTIELPGAYYVTGNLDGSGGGIDIKADNVTLDLMGYTIDGGGVVNDHGIDLSAQNNIIIKNGFIENFGLAGIYQAGVAQYALMIDVQVFGTGSLATTEAQSGIYIESDYAHVERCSVGNNDGGGISVGNNSKVIDSTAFNNRGRGISADEGSIISANSVSGNNGTYAVFGGGNTTISGNTVVSNTGSYGIYGLSGSIINGNAVYNQGGTYGIYGLGGVALTGNTATLNDGWGIFGFGSNLIKDNMAIANNQTNIAGQGGLRVGFDSRVVGNTFDGNLVNNIFVSSSGNVLKENHVTDSTNGIFFVVDGNYYLENTGEGNTTTFNLNGTTQTNGGGNVSF